MAYRYQSFDPENKKNKYALTHWSLEDLNGISEK